MDVSRETEAKLKLYQQLLVKWQSKINLVSPTTIDDSWQRHFVDSMQIEPLIPDDTKTIFDLGCGAGFPGLVLAIMRSNLDIHLIESDQKKCSFMRTVSRETNTTVHVHCERIESFISDVSPDVITARALASLVELFSYCEKWIELNPKLTLIFPKGERADQELNILDEHWKFDLRTCASQTNENAKILIFSDVYKV